MYIKAEQYLLYYMLNNIEVIKMYQNNIGYMPTDKYRKLAFEINYFYKNNLEAIFYNINYLLFSLPNIVLYVLFKNSKLVLAFISFNASLISKTNGLMYPVKIAINPSFICSK